MEQRTSSSCKLQIIVQRDIPLASTRWKTFLLNLLSLFDLLVVTLAFACMFFNNLILNIPSFSFPCNSSQPNLVFLLKKWPLKIASHACFRFISPSCWSDIPFASSFKVTKEKYFHKPTYNSLQSSLMAMKHHCVSHGVTSISMPRIGCGLDGLQWPKVRNIIIKVFQDTDMKLTIYTLWCS